jgi:hypothetical protein
MPLEVVVEVFESLDSLRSAINLASTCQTFWSLYKRLQATICLRVLPYDPRFNPKYEHGDQIQSWNKLYPKAVALFLAPIHKLERLESVLFFAQKRLSEFEQLPPQLQTEGERSDLREEVQLARRDVADEKEKQCGTWTDSPEMRAVGPGRRCAWLIENRRYCDVLIMI